MVVNDHFIREGREEKEEKRRKRREGREEKEEKDFPRNRGKLSHHI